MRGTSLLAFTLGLSACLALASCGSAGASSRGPRHEAYLLLSPEPFTLDTSSDDSLADLELMGKITEGLELDLGLLRDWGPPHNEQLKVLRVSQLSATVTNPDALAALAPHTLSGTARVSGEVLELTLSGNTDASETEPSRPLTLKLSITASVLQGLVNQLLEPPFYDGAEHLAPSHTTADLSMSLNGPVASPANGHLRLLVIRRDTQAQ